MKQNDIETTLLNLARLRKDLSKIQKTNDVYPSKLHYIRDKALKNELDVEEYNELFPYLTLAEIAQFDYVKTLNSRGNKIEK